MVWFTMKQIFPLGELGESQWKTKWNKVKYQNEYLMYNSLNFTASSSLEIEKISYLVGNAECWSSIIVLRMLESTLYWSPTNLDRQKKVLVVRCKVLEKTDRVVPQMRYTTLHLPWQIEAAASHILDLNDRNCRGLFEKFRTNHDNFDRAYRV